MKVEFWVIGKTNAKYLEAGTAIYEKRLQHYLPFNYLVIPDIRQSGRLKSDQLKKKEGEAVQKLLKSDDHLVLLDEQGKQFTSVAFAKHVDEMLQLPKKRLIFLVGGAFGFDERIYQRANAKLGLSKMTFSHQMIRLFFLEQLYRGMTILRNEPYHNQ